MFILFLSCLVITNVFCAPAVKNNVCRTFKAYANVNQNKNCFYNPDVDSTPYQTAERYGFLLENHVVTTKDGYILTLFRLLDAKRKAVKNKQPVALQHGVLVDGVSWMISGDDSLAFHLANSGLDVWIVNSRGTPFSLNHTNVSISEKDYWNFSFHEIGIYDMPAIIEEISNHTNRRDIIHIGHSMGGTASTVYSIVEAVHAQRYIKGIVHLAPAIKINDVQGLVRLSLPFYDLFMQIINSLGLYAIGQYTKIQKILLSLTCSRFPLILPCQIIEAVVSGLVVEQIRPEMLPVILSDFPVGLPIKTLIHYYQIISRKGRFQFFDYGPAINQKLYNSTDSPEYDIGEFTLPIHVFTGRQDFIATQKDVETFYNVLRCPKTLHIYDLAHNDYAYGKNVTKLYENIVNVIKHGFPSNNDIK